MAPEDALLIILIVGVVAVVGAYQVARRLSGHKCELIGGPFKDQDVNLPSLPKWYVLRDSVYKRDSTTGRTALYRYVGDLTEEDTLEYRG